MRQTTTKKGGVGAFLLGLLEVRLLSPCVTPVLAAILAVISGGIDLGVGNRYAGYLFGGKQHIDRRRGAGIGTVNQLGGSARFAKAGEMGQSRSGAVTDPGLYLLYLGF